MKVIEKNSKIIGVPLILGSHVTSILPNSGVGNVIIFLNKVKMGIKSSLKLPITCKIFVIA